MVWHGKVQLWTTTQLLRTKHDSISTKQLVLTERDWPIKVHLYFSGSSRWNTALFRRFKKQLIGPYLVCHLCLGFLWLLRDRRINSCFRMGLLIKFLSGKWRKMLLWIWRKLISSGYMNQTVARLNKLNIIELIWIETQSTFCRL